MEVTGIALQTVAAGEDVAFTETAVNGTKCIVHRQGSGIIKLRGITNQCKARFWYRIPETFRFRQAEQLERFRLQSRLTESLCSQQR